MKTKYYAYLVPSDRFAMCYIVKYFSEENASNGIRVPEKDIEVEVEY